MTRLAYQYVVLRCVPRPDREEFVNVGVVLYCQATGFLEAVWNLSAERLQAIERDRVRQRAQEHHPVERVPARGIDRRSMLDERARDRGARRGGGAPNAGRGWRRPPRPPA